MCRALGVDALDLISMLTKTYKLEKKDNLYKTFVIVMNQAYMPVIADLS